MKDYAIIRTKRKSLSLEIREDGALLVRAPLRAPATLLHDFVESKRGWIDKHRERMSKLQESRRRSHGGEKRFFFLGTAHRLGFFDPDGRSFLELASEGFRLYGKPVRAKVMLKAFYLKEAKKIFSYRVGHYSQKLGFNFRLLRITGAMRRWGSCSGENDINLPWRLVMAPLELIDYVIIHELCHIKHKNHSRAFWKEVGKHLPDYKERRRLLKEHGFKYNL